MKFMSIIDDKNRVKAKWMSFKKVGDKIEGTLVARRTVLNQLSGKDQIIYELKVPKDTEILVDGEKDVSMFEEYWNVGGKPGIDMNMKRVRLGQIVGFEFTEERPSKQPGMNPLKVVQTYADPSIVDEEWIKSQDEISADPEDKPEDVFGLDKSSEKVPFESKSTEEQVSDENLLMEINKLAMEKLGAKNAEEVKDKAMKATKLAFIEDNLPEILKALKELPTPKKKK